MPLPGHRTKIDSGPRQPDATSISATVTDHSCVRDSHMAMLSGLLRHTVLSRLALQIFLDAMEGRIANHPGIGNRVSDMPSKSDSITLEFPSSAGTRD